MANIVPKSVSKFLGTTDIVEAEIQATKLGKMWNEKVEGARAQNMPGNIRPSDNVLNLDKITADFRSKTVPSVKQVIDDLLPKPKQELRRLLHVKIQYSIDEYRKCILSDTYTDNELSHLLNPFGNTGELAFDACAAYDPAAAVGSNMLTRVLTTSL